MQFRSRRTFLALVALLAMSAVTASAASAAAPEFKPSTKQAFTGSTGTITIGRGSFSPVTCSKGTSTGEITGASTVGSVVLTLTGCETKEGSGCKFKSVGAKTNGEIITKALVGELGEVKTTEATSGVGLLLRPASGTEWAKIEGPCLLASPAPISGTLAAEVTPIKTLAKTSEFVFVGTSGSQGIKEITIKGKVNEPKFAFDGYTASWDTTETLTFKGNEVEIT
jgi:hypothetical protein